MEGDRVRLFQIFKSGTPQRQILARPVRAQKEKSLKPSSPVPSLQSRPTLCDPMDCVPPGPLFLGFSRQEHWSGLPLPPRVTNASVGLAHFSQPLLVKLREK